MIYYSYLTLGCFVLTLLGTRLTILMLRQKQALLDIPNVRSNHTRPVPRGGGIAVVFSLVVFLLLADAGYWLILGMLLLAAISLVDDWIRLSPLTRLLVQVFAVLIGLQEVRLPVLEAWMPAWAIHALIALAWLWFINLFNFMDGIDGISASEMIGIAGGIVIVTALTGTFSNAISLYALIVLGAGAGFLWWNWHPAKIFLGDVGSIPIGYLLGYLLLRMAAEGYMYAALILPAYYLADSTITLLRRIIRREKFWQAHSQHFYQQAVRSGLKHDMVVRYITGVNMLLILLAVQASLEPGEGWMFLSIAYGMVIAVLFFVMASPRRRKARRHVP